MPKDYAALAKKAAELTNKELGSEISQLTTFARSDLAELFPTKRDKEKLVELMRIVHEEAQEDLAIARLGSNLTELGSVALRLLKAVT